MSDSSNGLASQAGQPHWVFICLLLIIINKKFPRVPLATVLKLPRAKEAPLGYHEGTVVTFGGVSATVVSGKVPGSFSMMGTGNLISALAIPYRKNVTD